MIADLNVSYLGDRAVNSKLPFSLLYPEIFLKAAEKLNVLPSECIVIEDSSAGIRAAFNARMIAIHVVDLKEADEDILNHCYNSYKNLNEIQKVLIKK